MSKLLQLYRDNAGRGKHPVNVIKNEAEATIYIYGIISADWGIGAIDVISQLTEVGTVPVLNVRISSPGGDVFESRAIMNAIKRFNAKKVAHIDAICASAATSIAMACDEVRMASDAMYMIHNVQGGAFGDKSDLRETADLMETVEKTIVSDYTGKTGKTDADIIAMMDAETWMTAEQALENGFVDSVSNDESSVKNAWNLSSYSKAPQALRAPPVIADTPIPPAADPEPTAAAAPVKVDPPIDSEAPPVIQNAMSQANKNRLALIQAL